MQYQQQQQYQQDNSQIYETEEEEQQRISLYELVKNRREYSEDNPNLENPPVTKLLYAACLNESIKDSQYKVDIEQQISDVIQQIESDADEDIEHQLTGYLLIKNNFILHFLEGDSNIINTKFIRDYLYTEFKKEKSIFQHINIICFTEENPYRSFDKFYKSNSGQYQSGPSITGEVEKTEEQIQDLTWEIYSMFSEVSKRHSDKKNIREKLSADDMSMLLMKNQYLNIEEYYEMYLDDIEIKLDSEIVFPYTPSLITNLEYSERGSFPEVKL